VGESAGAAVVPINALVAQQQRAEAAATKFFERIQAGAPISARSLTPLVQQHELLRMEIEKTFGSIAAATPAVVAEYNEITAAVARATAVTRQMVVTMAEQRAELTVGGQQFTSLSTAVERALPAQRQYIAEAALGITALTMGWQLGRRVGESIGIEYATWDQSAKGVLSTTGDMLHTLNDVLAATVRLGTAVHDWQWGGDFDQIKRAVDDLGHSMAAAILQRAALLGVPGAASGYAALQLQGMQTAKSDYKYPTGGQFSEPSQIYDMLAVKSKMITDAEKEAADAEQKIVALKVQELDLQKQLVLLGKGSDIDKKIQTETLDYAKTRLQLTAEYAKAEAENNAAMIANINAKIGLEKQLHDLRVRNNAWDLLVAKDASSVQSLAFAGGVPSITNLMMAAIMAQTGQPLQTSPWMSGQGGSFIPGSSMFTPGDGAAKSFAQKFTDALGQAMSESKFKQSVGEGVGSAMMDLFTSGGHNMGQALAQGLRASIGGEIQHLVQDFFPHPGNQQGQDPNKLYIGGSKTPTGIAGGVAYGIAGAAQIGFGAYAAGQQSPSNAVASGALSGAASGAAIGNEIYPGYGAAIGAVVGVIIGAVAGEMGAQATRGNYQYGIPGIDKSGIATFTGDKNLTDAAIAQIKAQVQTEYDTIHDGLINLLTKFPNVAIPSISAITGQFQDNPSAHWGEHLQLWITGTLPKALMGALGDQLATGFEQLGMSPAAWKKMWGFLGGLDPAKAIGLMNTLADAMKSLFDPIKGTSTFFHADPMGLGKGSGSFAQGMMDIGAQNLMTPGQQLAEGDKEIFKLLGALKGSSPEGQIATLSQIAALSKTRYATELQAIQAIYDVAKATKDMMQSARDTLALQLMVKADGTPDYAAQSQFYKGKAQTDLSLISGASNAADAQKYLQQFISDIMAAENAGVLGGGNLKDWNKWATDQLPKGQTAMDTELAKLGASIDTANNLFNAQVDPALAAFTGTVDGSNVVVGNFTASVSAAIQPINDFGTALVKLTGAMNAMSASGFNSRTVAQRLSA
jgi:hypothetical protein